MERLKEILVDIFNNHESPEKIHVNLNPNTRDIMITIDDLDDEWFSELHELSLTVMGIPQVVEEL